MPPKQLSKRLDINATNFLEITENVYRLRKSETKKKAEAFECVCFDEGYSCDWRCQNRSMEYECSSSCRVIDCQNQRIGKGLNKNVERFDTVEKGKALRAVQTIFEGDFIMEYKGEFVDKVEAERRMKKYAESGVKHHYFMKVGNFYIDSTSQGNDARHINHSCEPNSFCEKWTIPGSPAIVERIAIFAAKQIEIGQEISINYRFDPNGPKQECRCESDNCSGFVGIRATDDVVPKEKTSMKTAELPLVNPISNSRMSKDDSGIATDNDDDVDTKGRGSSSKIAQNVSSTRSISKRKSDKKGINTSSGNAKRRAT